MRKELEKIQIQLMLTLKNNSSWVQEKGISTNKFNTIPWSRKSTGPSVYIKLVLIWRQLQNIFNEWLQSGKGKNHIWKTIDEYGIWSGGP